ncbi:MAG: hypothetical protein CMJ48_02425, partial [Planctomycetaceae bacterium]|nr:hypothetical protein [Planctomycetaceae bacterium]
QYVRDVDVKVIGTQNKEFTAGETDLRGVFVADAITGRSTVIARTEEDRYAFYRGETVLRPQQNKRPAKPGQDAAAEAAPAPSVGKDLLLRNIIESNGGINTLQRSNYKNLINNKDRGVKAKKAF